MNAAVVSEKCNQSNYFTGAYIKREMNRYIYTKSLVTEKYYDSGFVSLLTNMMFPHRNMGGKTSDKYIV